MNLQNLEAPDVYVTAEVDTLVPLEGFDDVVIDETVIRQGSTATNGFRYGELTGELWEERFLKNGNVTHTIDVYPHDGLDHVTTVEAVGEPIDRDLFVISAVKAALKIRSYHAKKL